MNADVAVVVAVAAAVAPNMDDNFAAGSHLQLDSLIKLAPIDASLAAAVAHSINHKAIYPN